MSARLIAVAASALVLAACSGDDTTRELMDATFDAMPRGDQRWLCSKSDDERRVVLDQLDGLDSDSAATRLDELCTIVEIEP